MSIRRQLQAVFFETLIQSYPTHSAHFSLESVEITPAKYAQFGDFQCNSAMKLSKILKLPPQQIANNWINTLKARPIPTGQSPLFETLTIAGPGFINIALTNRYLAEQVERFILEPRFGIQPLTRKSRVVIDYSSPNIAKEMHVGHLRTTIIGECLARIHEFVGFKVLRVNHIGDWGTQFGMLIAYLKNTLPNLESDLKTLSPTQLVAYYKAAKKLFDESATFKKQAQQEVVKLQSHEPTAQKIWQELCAISRKSFQEIYELLDIKLIERGESTYQDQLPKMIALLESEQFITESDGAKCVYLPGFVNRDNEPLPLIVQKSDGGFNYATTDLAALKHRVEIEKAEKILYVVDAGQAQHLQMVFETAKLAKFYDPQKITVEHVPFGLVLREDGKKFQTRSGKTEKLIDLLNQAIEKAHLAMKAKSSDIPESQLPEAAKILGINAVKYADLSCHRNSDYRFSYDKMLQFEGNTAAFLMYAYVRIQSIKRKVFAHNPTIEQTLKNTHILLNAPEEKALSLKILQFPDVILQSAEEYLPNRLTEYLFHLSEQFHAFFHQCRVEGTPEQNSRLLLCQATAKVLLQGFKLLGLKPLERM